MMKLTAFVLGLGIVLASFGPALAHDNEGLEGLVIGGVGGAAIGHVITGTPEGVILGSFLGGTIGMLATGNHNRNHVVIYKNRHHRQWPGYSYREHWPRRGYSHSWNNGYRNRWDHHRGRHHR